MKHIIAIATLVFLSSVEAKPPILTEIEEAGIVMWHGNCTYYGKPFQCIMVKVVTTEYLIVGEPHVNGLDVKYILGEGRVVWSHKWVAI